MMHRYSRVVSGQRQRGFTLIELGIVVAVIAILATVVLMGRGFLASSRTSKFVELVDGVVKGVNVIAGLNGGLVPVGLAIGDLTNRSLIPANIGNIVQGFNVRTIARTDDNTFTVEVVCPTAEACQDVINAKTRDASFGGSTAAAAAGTTLTFRL